MLWTVGALVLLRPMFEAEGWTLLTPTSVAAAALAVVPTVLAMQQPFHQVGPVWAYEESVRVGAGATLKVSDGTAGTIRGVQDLAQRAGMTPEAVVIDVTGRAPGLVHALGARPLNSPWVPGGAEGSADALRVTLDRLACRELRDVWLLDQPGGRYDMASTFYPAVGASARDFEVLGEVDLPSLSAAQALVEPPIRLLRDRRVGSVAEEQCRSARGTR